MKKELRYFKTEPAVVEADKTSEVVITPLERYYRFREGGRYFVELTPCSIPLKPFSERYRLLDISENKETIAVIAEGGVLRFRYHFKGEQKWRLHVFTEKAGFQNEMYDAYRECWTTLDEVARRGFTLEMYSLKPDLYALRPYKGDLHIHTCNSDGIESPETTAANYRKAGYDFIALTDHHVDGSSGEAREVLAGLDTDFAIYRGEEVHSDYIGQLHMVNFDNRFSVNDIILHERERVEGEIAALAESDASEGCFDKLDCAWRIWVYREIKRSGGLAILPHPLWDVCNAEHMSEQAIEFVFKEGLLDAFEVYGGVHHFGNNLQALLYQEMRERGYRCPIVASTDSHSSLAHGYEHFAEAYTVAFARDARHVRDAIAGEMTVAVLAERGQYPTVTGSVRLAKYAVFLLENYFPLHDELCSCAGVMMHTYCLERGDEAKRACELSEASVRRLEKSFFGGK